MILKTQIYLEDENTGVERIVDATLYIDHRYSWSGSTEPGVTHVFNEYGDPIFTVAVDYETFDKEMFRNKGKIMAVIYPN